MGSAEAGWRPPSDPRSHSDRERDQIAELAELARHEGFATAPDAALPAEPAPEGDDPEGPAGLGS